MVGRAALWATAVALLAGGCQDPNTPPPGPCGVSPVHCAAQSTCCPGGEVCGGDPDVVGCFAGECCPVIGGGPTIDSARHHPQVRLRGEN